VRPGAGAAARRLVRHLSLLACESSIRSPEIAAEATIFHHLGQDQIPLCRFLPCTRISATGGIQRHTEGRVDIHHSQSRAYRHAGGLSTQDASFILQWRRDWGRVRDRCLPLITAENFGSARLYFGTQYISLSILDLQFLARMFHIEQQQLRNYTIALLDVFLYATSSVTLVTYVEPVSNASDLIDYFHLLEELVTAV